MPSYVAYTNGLGVTEDNENGLAPGEAVKPSDFEPDEWDYHIQHGNIVRAGGPNDPNVLAANAEEEIPKDPKDLRIQQLEAQLELLTGRQGTPAPGTHLSDLADAQAEEEAAKEKKPSSSPSKSASS
jgi:hypothetical protein